MTPAAAGRRHNPAWLRSVETGDLCFNNGTNIEYDQVGVQGVLKWIAKQSVRHTRTTGLAFVQKGEPATHILEVMSEKDARNHHTHPRFGGLDLLMCNGRFRADLTKSGPDQQQRSGVHF